MARRTTRKPQKVTQRFPLRYSSEQDFLTSVLDLYHKDVQADEHNIIPAREDMQFVIGDQWDPGVKSRRDRLKKPSLTVNRLPAFVAQYVGSWLQTDTTIKLSPARGGTKATAEVRQGLIRTITRTRAAKRALHKAMENAYICGVGNFKIAIVESENDVFLRDIVLETQDDPFSVIWDRASREPTGADANHCFVTRYMTQEDFKEAYPKAASTAGWSGSEMDYSVMTAHGWEIDEMVRICEFWQMRREPITVAMEAETGDVIDVTGKTPEEIVLVAALDTDGSPIVRQTVRPYAECYVLTNSEVLEGPYRLDVCRLPVIRVEGWSLQEASVKYRWGFVRNAKDPQRLHNYWRSILAEELTKSPSAKWLLDATAMKTGLADKFRNAHLSGDNVLMWDSQADGAKPEFIPPPMVNQAVLTEAQMTVQDIRDVTNRHEASMGMTSNEVSGKAITARQRVSELGDVVYIENMNAALAEAGRVLNDLIPQVFDTNRVVKITGDDDMELAQEINGDFGDATPDITKGKYDITYTTGPSYATKRQEAVDVMMTLMNTMPQVGNVVADIIVRNMDIPGADEIEERLASMLPPGMVNPERLPARRREQVAKQQEAQQQAQQAQMQIQQAQIEAEIAKTRAEAMETEARAMRQLAQARLAASQIGVDAAKVDNAEFQTAIKAFEAGLKEQGLQKDVFQMGLQNAQSVQQAQMERESEDEASSGGDSAE